MSEERFAPLHWTNLMSVGVSVIDTDHKKLLDLLNEVDKINKKNTSNNSVIRSVLYELVDYTEYHFQREELLMQVCEYPDLEKHKQAHQILINKVKNYVEQYKVNPGLIDLKMLRYFLEMWLVDHIIGMDKGYESWMQGKDELIDKTNTKFEQERH